MEKNTDVPMEDVQSYSKILRQQLVQEKANGNLNYTEKRILKDLEEFEFNVNPDMGISARPLKESIYKWHANIKGIADTPYDQGIFHLEITIPGDYPNKPPVIETVTPMTNNFFFSGKYRSEMIEEEWCSGFSLFSLLLQIQFGMYDYQGSTAQTIRNEAEASKTFKCTKCEHNGTNHTFPPFESALKDGPVDYSKKSEEEKLVEDTYCFHTRMNVKETIQGTGVAFSRLMRTTEVSRIYSTIDLVSQKAFKEGLRKSVNKKRFSHWLPLYFKATCDVDKTVDLFRKHLSDISAGSKDKFDEEMILQVLPKLVLIHCVQLMNDKAYSSIQGIRMLNYFHRAFLFLLEMHPQMQFELEKTLERFINDEEFRGKEQTIDIGMILAMVTVSKKFRFADIIKPYFHERLVRNVFHIIKEVPEFETLNDQTYNQAFANRVFGQSEKGWKVIMFFAYYNNYIIDKNQDHRDLEPIIEEYDKRYSRLYYKIEEELQKEVTVIKTVDNFNAFFEKVGMKTMSNNELKQLLINAVVTSKDKGYHGGYDVYFPMPEVKDQVKEVLKDKVSLLSFHNPYGEDVKMMDEEEDFLKYIKKRFTWTNSYFAVESENVTPEFLAEESDLRNTSNKYNLNLKESFQNLHVNSFSNDLKNSSTNKPYNGYTWKDLFIKLDFEAFIYLNEYTQDKEALKTYLDIVAPQVKGLVLKQPSIEQDDVSFSTYTDIITACAPRLERLILVGDTQAYPLTQGFITCLRLGFKGAKSIALKELGIHFINYEDDYGEPMPLDTFDNVQLESLLKVTKCIDTLHMSNISLSIVCLDKIFKVVEPENFREISLVNCNVDKYVGKDLLLKKLSSANNLEVLNLSHNKIEHAACCVFKALAGKEHLRVLDLSYNFLTHAQDIDKYFKKFIEQTPNIEYLNFAFSNIHNKFSEDDIEAIGGLKKLKGISFESSTCKMNEAQLKAMARCIIASKNFESPLAYIILRGCFNTYPDYEEFFGVLSDLSSCKEAEGLEGFELVDDPMGADPVALIKYLDISLGNFSSGFEQNKLKKGEYPGLKYIFTLVESLNMDSCQMTEKDARMIKYCMKEAGVNTTIKSLTVSNNPILSKGAEALASTDISELDLSNCKIGVGGACAVSKQLSKNIYLKKLNLYNNGIKVEGARFIAQGLEENKTLEFLDVGSNLIRNKGFHSLKTCLGTNVKVLAAKNNHINEAGFNKFMESYYNSENSHLKTLLLASNDVSMYTIKLTEEDLNDKLYMDLSLKLENHNERTLFLCGVNPKNTKPLLKKYFNKKGCGVIENIDIIRGREKKKGKINIFGFVKFAHKNGKMRVIQQLKEFEEKEIKF